MAQDSFVLGAANAYKKEKKKITWRLFKISACETMNKCNGLGSQRRWEENCETFNEKNAVLSECGLWAIAANK